LPSACALVELDRSLPVTAGEHGRNLGSHHVHADIGTLACRGEDPARASRVPLTARASPDELVPERPALHAKECRLFSCYRSLRRAEPQFRFILIMGAAPKLEITRRCLSARGKWHHMVIFEKSSFGAPPVWTVECTAPFVAVPHGSLHCGRNVTRILIPAAMRARAYGLADSCALELFEQYRDRSFEDDGRIAVRHHVTQQILSSPQLVVRLAANGELNLVPFRRDGLHRRCTRRRRVDGSSTTGTEA